MMKLIINLVTLEKDLKNIHHYVDFLVGEAPGLHDNPAVGVLRDCLNNVEIRLHEALRQWPQLGLGIIY